MTYSKLRQIFPSYATNPVKWQFSFFSPNFAKSEPFDDPLPIMISNWHHFFFCLVCCCLGKIKEDANNNQTLLTVHGCFSYIDVEHTKKYGHDSRCNGQIC